MKRKQRVQKTADESPAQPLQQASIPIMDEELPHPHSLLEQAEMEQPRRVLDQYWDAMRTLREKRFTFREIADWLGERGIKTDHNAVWRAYSKHMDDLAAHQEQEADEEQERKDMGA